ncbi:hypothetical protein ACUN8C_14760 [Kushneria sp. Sum13]|uniref:hypothetical protein n=1 Tax=Kushneria sp. Sum13 TaxID=3459196 RepID=UPI00404653A3
MCWSMRFGRWRKKTLTANDPEALALRGLAIDNSATCWLSPDIESRFAAQQGVIDESAVVREMPGSMRRAGADLIMTYFAPQLMEEGL